MEATRWIEGVEWLTSGEAIRRLNTEQQMNPPVTPFRFRYWMGIALSGRGPLPQDAVMALPAGPKRQFFLVRADALSHMRLHRLWKKLDHQPLPLPEPKTTHKPLALNADQIAEARRLYAETNVTQAALAEQYGVSRYTMHKYLTGKGF